MNKHFDFKVKGSSYVSWYVSIKDGTLYRENHGSVDNSFQIREEGDSLLVFFDGKWDGVNEVIKQAYEEYLVDLILVGVKQIE